MAYSFAQLLTLFSDRFSKPLIGQKINANDVKDVANAIANFITGDGSSLPPYSRPNSTSGKIPRLDTPYQYADSALSHLAGLGNGIRLDGGWRMGNNALSKVELFQPTTHATNRYEASITLPKGSLGSVTLEVIVRGLGQSAGLIRKVYTFDASVNTGAANTVYNAQGDIATKIYVGDPDWSGANIVIPIHEKTAVNVAKIYVVEVLVIANESFLTALLAQSTLLSAVTTTARSAGSTNTVSSGALPATQMSVTSDVSGVKLVNDVTTPNASQFYGTNAAGTRGWYDWLSMQSLLLAATPNRQTASYTLALTDAWGVVEMNVATANNLTIPPNASVAFPLKTQIMGVQYGAGQTTVVAGVGVTLLSPGGKLKFNTQYSPVTFMQAATNVWYVWGDTTT